MEKKDQERKVDTLYIYMCENLRAHSSYSTPDPTL